MYHSISFCDEISIDDMLADVTKKQGGILVYKDLKNKQLTLPGKNTWDDWFLIPTSRPYLSPPETKSIYVDIPGANGSIDLSETVSGMPVYSNRTGSWEFAIENDHRQWEDTYSVIANFLHGKTKKIILEDDPLYYYEGRFEISGWTSGKAHSNIELSYNVYPYKFSILSSTDDWLWDPFNFESDYAVNMSGIAISGTKTITIYGSPMVVSPRFTVSLKSGNTMVISTGNLSYTISKSGTYAYPAIMLDADGLDVTFTGTGTVTVTYERGSL